MQVFQPSQHDKSKYLREMHQMITKYKNQVLQLQQAQAGQIAQMVCNWKLMKGRAGRRGARILPRSTRFQPDLKPTVRRVCSMKTLGRFGRLLQRMMTGPVLKRNSNRFHIRSERMTRLNVY